MEDNVEDAFFTEDEIWKEVEKQGITKSTPSPTMGSQDECKSEDDVGLSNKNSIMNISGFSDLECLTGLEMEATFFEDLTTISKNHTNSEISVQLTDISPNETIDEEVELSNDNRHATPYHSACRNLYYRLESSTDSGFESNTPSVLHSSRDLSVLSDHSPTSLTSPKISDKSTPISNFSLSPFKRKFSDPIKLCQFKHHSLDGAEFIDFLYYLGQKERHTLVTSKLFSYLSDDDLESVSKVSKTWQHVLMDDSRAKKRLAVHRKIMMNTKENRNTLKTNKMRDQRKQGAEWSSSPFMDIQNSRMNSSPTKRRTQSASSPGKTRFDLFRIEGEKLDRNAKLMQCPRCTLPARCNEAVCSNLGECISPRCSYKFCTNCRTEFHSPKKCFRISSCPIKRKNMIIGSKASKRRLSRT